MYTINEQAVHTATVRELVVKQHQQVGKVETCSARLAFQLTVHSPSLLGTIDQSACMDAAHLSVGLIVQKPSKGPQQTLYCTRLPAKQKACLKKCASMAEPLGVVLARLGDIFVTQLMTKTAWH